MGAHDEHCPVGLNLEAWQSHAIGGTERELKWDDVQEISHSSSSCRLLPEPPGTLGKLVKSY